MRTLARCAPLLLAAPGFSQGDVLRLVQDDPIHQGQYFGSCVAVHGEYLLVGALNDPVQGGAGSGALYVFDRDSGAQVAKLYAPDGVTGGRFGTSAVSFGEHVLVGCPYDDQAGPFTGSAYLLEIPSGAMLAKFTGSTGKFGSFGQAIAVDGKRAFFGAYRDSKEKYEKGAVFVVDLETKKKVKLVASDGNMDDRFGFSVAVGEGLLVVGAPEKGAGAVRGRVYVYDSETLEELYTLNPKSNVDWHFGSSVAVADGRILVGAPKTWNKATGVVFVYDARSGALLRTLLPEPSGTPLGGDLFGFSLRAEGELALVGAPFQDGVAQTSGLSFLFHVPSGKQLARFALPSSGPAWGGYSVALEGGSVLVGAPFDDTFNQEGGGAWLIRLEHDLGESYCGPASLNSSGASAVISGYGSAIVAVGSFELTAAQLPLEEFGLFLAGDAADFVPFAGGSQGHLCLGGNLARFRDSVLATGSEGRFSLAVDLEHLPTYPPSAVKPGETWRFQAWFRDHNPGPTSNFTDGLAVRFQ